MRGTNGQMRCKTATSRYKSTGRGSEPPMCQFVQWIVSVLSERINRQKRPTGVDTNRSESLHRILPYKSKRKTLPTDQRRHKSSDARNRCSPQQQWSQNSFWTSVDCFFLRNNAISDYILSQRRICFVAKPFRPPYYFVTSRRLNDPPGTERRYLWMLCFVFVVLLTGVC